MTNLEQALLDRIKVMDEEHARKRGALLAALAVERGETPTPVAEPSGPPPRPLVAIGLNAGEIVAQKAIVKMAIKSLVDDGITEFTKSDVLARLYEGKAAGVNVSDHTLNNIASFLWRFHSDVEKFIVIKEKGGGQRQSVYMLAPPNSTP